MVLERDRLNTVGLSSSTSSSSVESAATDAGKDIDEVDGKRHPSKQHLMPSSHHRQQDCLVLTQFPICK